MKTHISSTIIAVILLVLAIPFIGSSLQPVTASSNPRSGTTVPTTVAPTGTIVDKTPTYKWTKVTGATKYEYRLYKSGTTTPLWTKTLLSSVCGSVYCTKTPTTELAPGKYSWQVRAYISGAWKTWSLRKTFTVADGFISQFNGSMTGWATKAGGNWQVNSTAMYDDGVYMKWSSAVRNTQQYDNFTLSARVRQTGGFYDKNCIMVRMGTLVKTDNSWYPGYGFRFQNNGYYYIIRYNSNGTTNTIQDTTYNAAITDDWNILKVDCGWVKF